MPEVAPIEDAVGVSMPFDMKTDVISLARRQRLTPAELGRRLFAAALAEEGNSRWLEDEARRDAVKKAG